jgi:hypothetical protein
MAKDKGKEFKDPRGICQCGHTGNGENSQHWDSPYPGTGACVLCRCTKYKEEKRTRKYQNFLAAQKNR